MTTRFEARQYLNKYLMDDLMIDLKIEKRNRWKDRAENASPSYDGGVSSSASDGKVASAASSMVDIADELDGDIASLRERMADIVSLIKDVYEENELYGLILTARYLNGMTPIQVTVFLQNHKYFYTNDHVTRLTGLAVDEVARRLEER